MSRRLLRFARAAVAPRSAVAHLVGVKPQRASRVNNVSQMTDSSTPEFMDGARVLFTAPAAPGQIGHDYATGEPAAISYFAIATYPEHEPRVYLFGVSSAHEVVCDFDHDSAEEAMQTARTSGFTCDDFRPKVA